MNTQVAQMQVVNGVNVTDLFNTVGAMKEMPGLAKFKFRIANQWIDCGHSQSKVSDFHGAHQDHLHASTFLLEADEPPILLGQDQGANPVEHLCSCGLRDHVHGVSRGCKRIGYAVAEDNLRLGRTVVADSVNPVKLTRDAWTVERVGCQSAPSRSKSFVLILTNIEGGWRLEPPTSPG